MAADPAAAAAVEPAAAVGVAGEDAGDVGVAPLGAARPAGAAAAAAGA